MAETRNLTARGLLPVLPWMRARPARPGRIARLWLVNAILCAITMLLFPHESISGSVSFILLLTGTPIFAAFLAAWALGLRSSTLGLVALLAGMFLGAQLAWLAMLLATDLASWPPPVLWVVAVPYLFVTSLAIWAGYSGSCSGKRRAAAIGLVLAAHGVTAALAGADAPFWRLSSEVQRVLDPSSTVDDEQARHMPEADRLWEAQPALVRKALEGLEPRVPGTTNVYGMAIAAQGSQTLFAREAKFALKVISARFQGHYRGGILFSNGAADHMRSPLATGGNIAAALWEIAGTIDPSRDVLVIYLTSHGSRDGVLSTDLPDYQQIRPIWAGALAATLDKARLKRRVVIVSACYSATWIPALANDDTIVITAAAKDRTSFGCSDTRRLTYFGEAFLEGPLSRGASLQQAFDGARRTVAKWEQKEGLTPSLPQAFVGKNMQSVWIQTGTARAKTP